MTTFERFSYELLLSYCGTNYYGWQKQPQDLSIQYELEKALAKVSKSENLKTLAAGRTDAGVHALGQVVKVDIPLQIPGDSLREALNTNLPPDIRVREAHVCEEEFHPIRDAYWKEYWYLLSFSKPGPFHVNQLGHIKRTCDSEKLKRVAKLFEGRHDFKDFMCTGTPVVSTIREIYVSDIEGPFSSPLYFPPKVQGEISGGGLGTVFPVCYLFRVVGEGFLKQMVRLMMGTLTEIASGRVSEQDLLKSLEGEDLGKGQLGPVAPASGLYLAQVGYREFPHQDLGFSLDFQ